MQANGNFRTFCVRRVCRNKKYQIVTSFSFRYTYLFCMLCYFVLFFSSLCCLCCEFFLLFVAYVVKKSYLCPVPHAGVSCPHRVREEDG